VTNCPAGKMSDHVPVSSYWHLRVGCLGRFCLDWDIVNKTGRMERGCHTDVNLTMDETWDALPSYSHWVGQADTTRTGSETVPKSLG
jgi:hypothetical protein